MRWRRWWLALVSVLSLAALIVAGVTTAYSVPIADGPYAGSRALVVPPPDATRLPTVAATGEGALILVADPGATFPAAALNASIVRALAYATPTADGSYVPPTLDFNLSGENVTIDVAALAGGRSGYVVKGEGWGGGEDNVTFATTDRVLGTVSRFDPSGRIVALFVGGSVGFVLPLVVLMATHRGAGRAGLPAGVPAGACPECRAPVPQGSDFCTRCGAWLKEAPP